MYIDYNTPLPELSPTASQAEIIEAVNNVIKFLNVQNFPDPNLGPK